MLTFDAFGLDYSFGLLLDHASSLRLPFISLFDETMVFSDVFLGEMAFDFLILDRKVLKSLVKVETIQFCACSVCWVGELTRVAHAAKSSFY